MSRRQRRFAAVGLVALLGLANVATQNAYLASVSGKDWTGMLDRLHDLSKLAPQVPVRIGVPDLAKPEIVALYTKGHPTWNIDGRIFSLPPSAGSAYPDVEDLVERLNAAYHPLEFDLGPANPGHDFMRFEPPAGISSRGEIVILPAGDESVVNGSQVRPTTGRLFAVLEAEQRNTLVQVDSSLGHIIIPGVIENVALWQHEVDFAGSTGGIQGIGRHLLFEVLNPVPGSRLLVDYTTGGLAGQGVVLPSASVIGTERVPLTFQGGGAGRTLSEPVTPREIDGHFYIALDMGVDATRFRSERHGLTALYNTQLNDDPRYLVGFTRNISLLTPEQVAALNPPVAIAHIPADLMDPGLLFSGITEDGWIGDKAWFELGAPETSDVLHLTGMAPGFSAKLANAKMTIRVDGVQVLQGKLGAGVFDVALPIPAASGTRHVEFDIDGMDRLPLPDGRLASIHLESLVLDRRAPPGPTDGLRN